MKRRLLSLLFLQLLHFHSYPQLLFLYYLTHLVLLAPQILSRHHHVSHIGLQFFLFLQMALYSITSNNIVTFSFNTFL